MELALVETVRVRNGTAPLWLSHLGRLTRSALDLGLPVPDLNAPEGGPDRIVRFEVSASGVVISERDVSAIDTLSLAIVPVPHQGYPHKTSDRRWLEAARAVARAQGADDALLLDGNGHVIEATRWAVGWWRTETLCFPPFSLGGLPSISRQALSRMVRGGLSQELIHRSELAHHPMIACNAARGVVPVEMLDGLPLVPNHRSRALAERFWASQET